MNIEEIMKPYFDKVEEFSKRPENFKYEQDDIINKYEEEIEKYKLESQAYESEIFALRMRLQTLRNNKNSEIEEYVKNAVAERPDFYVGYGAMIRKDLEQEYVKREKELEKQIIEANDKLNNSYLKLAETNKLLKSVNDSKISLESIHRVDVRELVDVKHDLRKVLIRAKKELELKLKETQLYFDQVMYKLTTFKHEYSDDHTVTNGNEYRKLFEESNHLVEVEYNLKRELNKVEESLKITELTEEEIKITMMSMTDVEKREYERRNKIDSIISTVEKLTKEEIPAKESVEEVIENKEDSTNLENSDIVPIADENTKKQVVETEILENNYSEFIKNISKDVLSSVDKLRGVKVTDGKHLSVSNPEKDTEELELEENSVQLVNGLYLNKRDVFKALNNYVRKNKGQSFNVKGINETLTVTRKSLRAVKEFLRECTIKKLFSEKKLGAFDIRRVFGKDKAEEYTKKTTESKIEMPSGDYILRSDIHEALKLLFVEKEPTWLETLKSKFIRPELKGLDEVPYEEVEDETLDDEYEVVKTK